jgi:aconitate hydratase
MFREKYADVFTGDERWRELPVPEGDTLRLGPEDSTYVRRRPTSTRDAGEPAPVEDIVGARCLALLGDSITTDHISPGRRDQGDSPAGKLPRRARRRARRTSTPTARGAATTR